MTPKLMMKETISVVDAMPNSFEPISGTTVLSIPTIPPTKALTRTSNANCRQFSRNPSLTREVIGCGSGASTAIVRLRPPSVLRWPFGWQWPLVVQEEFQRA